MLVAESSTKKPRNEETFTLPDFGPSTIIDFARQTLPPSCCLSEYLDQLIQALKSYKTTLGTLNSELIVLITEFVQPEDLLYGRFHRISKQISQRGRLLQICQ